MTPDPNRPRTQGGDKVCAVCSVPLDWLQTDTGSPWIHFFEVDHPAVPVDPAELASVNWKCDFCSAHHARWELPAADFQTPWRSVSVGGWCVCDGCKPFVEARNWVPVADRAIKFLHDTYGSDGHTEWYRAELLICYARLEVAVTGPIVINPPSPSNG